MACTTRICIVAVSPLVQRRNTWSCDSDWKKRRKTNRWAMVEKEQKMSSERSRWKETIRMDKFIQTKDQSSPSISNSGKRRQRRKTKWFLRTNTQTQIHTHTVLILNQPPAILRSGNFWTRHSFYILSSPQRAYFVLTQHSSTCLRKVGRNSPICTPPRLPYSGACIWCSEKRWREEQQVLHLTQHSMRAWRRGETWW